MSCTIKWNSSDPVVSFVSGRVLITERLLWNTHAYVYLMGHRANFFFFSIFWLIFMYPSSQIISKLNLETDNRGISNAGENVSARIGELRSQPGCS